MAFLRLFQRKSTDYSQVIHSLTLRIKDLEENLAALESKHERLRGRFYATKGPDVAPVPQTKGDILRAHGYTPGKPIPREG